MKTPKPVKISKNCWKNTDQFGNVYYTKTSDPNLKLHREDGPAVEYSNGDKEWWINGKLHRIDGPAVEYVYGYKEWWFEGKQIVVFSQEDFEKWLEKYSSSTSEAKQ